MAKKPTTPAPREMFVSSALPLAIGADGKFVGSINAREVDVDGASMVLIEQVNRRGTVKILHKLDPDEAIALGVRLIAAGRRGII